MKIKSLIIVDEETGKEYAFTHRSVVEVKEYEAEKDPEVQGTGLTELVSAINTTSSTITFSGTNSGTKVEPLKAKKKKAKR